MRHLTTVSGELWSTHLVCIYLLNTAFPGNLQYYCVYLSQWLVNSSQGSPNCYISTDTARSHLNLSSDQKSLSWVKRFTETHHTSESTSCVGRRLHGTHFLVFWTLFRAYSIFLMKFQTLNWMFQQLRNVFQTMIFPFLGSLKGVLSCRSDQAAQDSGDYNSIMQLYLSFLG